MLGCTTQVIQRQLLQQCGAEDGVRTMNLLDPDLMPYSELNFSTCPAHNPEAVGATPLPGTADYGVAVLHSVRSVAPEAFGGQLVRFFSTVVSTVPGSDPAADPDLAALVNLELWGFPTSRPAVEPTNAGFVYQRFQRGIMHFDASTRVTRGILLADYFKGIVIGQPGPTLPPDLLVQAATGRFFAQYCPGALGWTCRPDQLPGTDLTFAFEPQ